MTDIRFMVRRGDKYLCNDKYSENDVNFWDGKYGAFVLAWDSFEEANVYTRGSDTIEAVNYKHIVDNLMRIDAPVKEVSSNVSIIPKGIKLIGLNIILGFAAYGVVRLISYLISQ